MDAAMAWLTELSGGLSGWAFWLPLIWAGLIAVAIAMYVLLDGFDLGVGILFRSAKRPEWRDRMMLSVAPMWDGNETWLILGGAGLFAVFPLAYALIMPALYIPVIVMLLALIFRGIAFEFRFKAEKSRFLWDVSFYVGSLVATFSQGVVLGAFVQGIATTDGTFTGGRFDWLAPFPLLTGLGLVAGYGLIGSCWVVMKTTGELEAFARKRAKQFLVATIVAMAVVSATIPFLGTEIQRRWFDWPNIAILAPVPLLTALVAFFLWRSLDHAETIARPFLLSIAMFLLGYVGLGVSLFPYIVPPSVTIWQAAAVPSAQGFTLVGAAITLPAVFAYTAWCYWVFRGKTAEDIAHGYH